jgi:hypothetical protein
VAKRQPIAPFDLPAHLDMYVNADEFNDLMNADRAFFEGNLPEKLAPRFHQAYSDDARDRKRPVWRHLNRKFERRMPPGGRITSKRRAAFRRCWRLWGSVWRKTSRESPKKSRRSSTHLVANLDRLAEAERDGWWPFGERNG